MDVDPALLSRLLLANSWLGRHSGDDVGDGLPGLVLHLVVVGVAGVDCQGVRDGLLMPSAGDELPAHGLSPHVLLLWATSFVWRRY